MHRDQKFGTEQRDRFKILYRFTIEADGRFVEIKDLRQKEDSSQQEIKELRAI